MTCGICGKVCGSFGELAKHSCDREIATLRLRVLELEAELSTLRGGASGENARQAREARGA